MHLFVVMFNLFSLVLFSSLLRSAFSRSSRPLPLRTRRTARRRRRRVPATPTGRPDRCGRTGRNSSSRRNRTRSDRRGSSRSSSFCPGSRSLSSAPVLEQWGRQGKASQHRGLSSAPRSIRAARGCSTNVHECSSSINKAGLDCSVLIEEG